MIKGADIIYKDSVRTQTAAAWKKILKSGWVILGEWTEKFEFAWAQYCGRKYGVAVSNDTAALEIALRLIKDRMLKKGKKSKLVIVPSNGFFSIVHAMDRTGFTPVFVDIDIDNNINFTLEDVVQIIKELGVSSIAAVVIMPCGGIVGADTMKIVEYCKQNGIYVIEDAAHGHGTMVDGHKVGSFGDISCFSFYATKVMNTAEGGMLVTDDEEWAKEAKLYRNYGREGDFGVSRIVRDGNNFRMTEFTAALGYYQTSVIDVILNDRKEVAHRYMEKIAGYLDYISPVQITSNVETNWYKFMCFVKDGVDKAEFKKKMLELEVEMSGDVYDLPIPRQPIYVERFDGVDECCQQADEFCRRHICLPFYEGMGDPTQRVVLENIKKVLR